MTVSRVYVKDAGTAAWLRRGGTSRDGLVPGTYKPDATTTGAYLTGLPKYNEGGSNTIIVTENGKVFQNQEIFGDLQIQASNVVIKNCILRGGNFSPTGNSGIINANNSKCFNLTVEDCTFDPIKPDHFRDGIVGHEYTARRNLIMHTNDGFGAFITPTIGANCNVNVEANYVFDLTYWYPDPNTNHTDGTHNDCMQIQGGANIHVIGNNFHGTAVLGAGSGTNPDKPRLLSETPTNTNGSGIIIQNNTGATLANVIVEKNWFNGGLAGVNMKPGSYTVQNNLFGRDWYDYTPTGSHSEYPMRGDDSTTTSVTGILTNRWEDTNVLMSGAKYGGTRYDGIRWNDIAD